MTKATKLKQPKQEVIELMPGPTAIVASPSQANNVLAIIENAVNGGADVTTMERLYSLYEKNLEREQKAVFAADYVRMKPELPLVLKKKTNTQTSSKYAPLEDVNQAVDHILAKYNFGTSTKIVKQDDHGVWIRAELWHASGHIEATEVYMPWDDKGMAGKVNKTMPHAISSSVSYGKRVSICALLNISTGDDKDGNKDQRGKDKKPEDPFAQPEQSLKEVLNGEADILKKAMGKLKSSDKKGQLIMDNLPLLKQMDENGMGDLVAELHEMAKEAPDAT